MQYVKVIHKDYCGTRKPKFMRTPRLKQMEIINNTEVSSVSIEKEQSEECKSPLPIQPVTLSPIFKSLKQKLLPKINKSENSTKMP